LSGHIPSFFPNENVKSLSSSCVSGRSILPSDENVDWKEVCQETQAKLTKAEAEILQLKEELRVAKQRITFISDSKCIYQEEIRVLRQKAKRQEEANSRKRRATEELQKKLNEANQWKKRKIETEANSDLINQIMSRKGLSSRGREYNTGVRDFAFQVHYYSPRAYEFLRTAFDGLLPHSRNFLRWTDHITTQPGI
jgi:DNA-binding GntR family transcriptional regulator